MGYVGNGSWSGTDSNAGANYEYVSQYTSSGTFSSTTGYLLTGSGSAQGSAKIKMVVYADSSNLPGSLLGTSNELTGWTANTVLAFTFGSSISFTNGTKYWIGYHSDSGFNVRTLLAGTNRTLSRSYASGPLDPWSGGSASSYQMQAWLTNYVNLRVSKGLGYAVTRTPETSVCVSKALAYAVTWVGNPGISVSKALAYAVVEPAPTANIPPSIMVIT